MFLFLIFDINANDLSAKIFLDGFSNAHIGLGLTYKRIDSRLTGAINSVNSKFWKVDGRVSIGAMIKQNSTYDVPLSVGSYFQYTHTSFENSQSGYTIRFRPSISLSFYRYFGHFIIGGNAPLELWDCQKTKHDGDDFGWSVTRVFNIVPEFIIGYRF